jgi:hypothetical protein
MLLAPSPTMNRKLLALAIVLLLGVLAPATAIIGFCARMPCCGHASADPLALATGRADCCTTLTCYDSPSATLATAGFAAFSLLVVPALVVSAPPPPAAAPSTARLAIDSSPPRAVRDRLATLSTLLI